MNNEVIELKISEHDKELENHNNRLNKLEQDGVELKAEIKNLCIQLEGLTTVMKWFIGLLIGSFVGFFFYSIQQGLFK